MSWNWCLPHSIFPPTGTSRPSILKHHLGAYCILSIIRLFVVSWAGSFPPHIPLRTIPGGMEWSQGRRTLREVLGVICVNPTRASQASMNPKILFDSFIAKSTQLYKLDALLHIFFVENSVPHFTCTPKLSTYPRYTKRDMLRCKLVLYML